MDNNEHTRTHRQELRNEYLASLIESEIHMKAKHWSDFKNNAQWLSEYVYVWRGAVASCTRELWLMGVCNLENITYTNWKASR